MSCKDDVISRKCMLVASPGGIFPLSLSPGAADIGPTSLSQDSYYDYLPAPRLEASLSYDPSSSSSSYSSPSHSATAEDIDGSGMSRSLDRRFL